MAVWSCGAGWELRPWSEWTLFLQNNVRVCNGDRSFSVLTQYSFVKSYMKKANAMHTNLYRGSNFSVTIWILLLIYVCSITENSFALVRNLKGNSQLIGGLVIRNMMFHAVPGKLYNSNFKFTLQGIMLLFNSFLLTWLYALLLQAGDVHPNPGPSSNSSSCKTYLQRHQFKTLTSPV